LHLIEVAPQIIGSGDLAALKKEVADWQPNLVYIDTLGASAAGQNLGLIEVGTEIGKKLREFCQECKQAPYVSDVVFLHHIGKDDSKGATGSRYFMNDPDQALELSYLQNDGLLRVEVTKARGGEKGRKVMFGVRKLKLPNEAEIVAVYPLAKNDPKREPPKPDNRRNREAEQVDQ